MSAIMTWGLTCFVEDHTVLYIKRKKNISASAHKNSRWISNRQTLPLPHRVRPAHMGQAAVCFSSALLHVNLSEARKAEFLPLVCTQWSLRRWRHWVGGRADDTLFCWRSHLGWLTLCWVSSDFLKPMLRVEASKADLASRVSAEPQPPSQLISRCEWLHR